MIRLSRIGAFCNLISVEHVFFLAKRMIVTEIREEPRRNAELVKSVENVENAEKAKVMRNDENAEHVENS